MYKNLYKSIRKTIYSLKNVDFNSSKLAEIESKLQEKEFNLVVMGQFKRGKSTFINSLLGSNILPSAILPLTSIVTIVNYSEDRKALIKYKNGKQDSAAIEDIKKYVTEKYNPENRLQVKEVNVFYPSKYLQSGIRIVDTPGIGSVFEHNTDAAYDYLPNCDAAIFVMSPDPPISKAEIEFLRSAKGYIDKFFFILNKTDTVSSLDLYDVIAFNKKLLETELDKEIEILPISALMAADAKNDADNLKLEKSNIQAVEEKIITPLKNEKVKIFGLSITNALIRYVNGLETACRLQQKADELSLEEFENKIKEFKEFAKRISRYKEENEFILKGKIKQLSDTVDENIEQLKNKELPSLIKKTLLIFREKLKQKIKTEELDDIMKDNMIKEIKDIFTEFEDREIKTISRDVESIYADLAEKTNSIIKKIIDTTSSIFNVDLKAFIAVESLSEKSSFSFKFKNQIEALAIIGTFIRRKLPIFVGKIIIEQHIKTTTEEIFDRHCGRMKYSFRKNILDTTGRFKYELDEKIDNTLLTIEDVLEKSMKIKTESEDSAYENLEEIRQRLDIAEKSKLELASIKKKWSI